MRKTILLLLVLLFAGGYAARVVSMRAMHADDCHVIGLEIASRAAQGERLDDDQLQALVAQLIRASVIHGRIAPDGSAGDLCGNPFLVSIANSQIRVATQRSLWDPLGVEVVVAILARNTPPKAFPSPPFTSLQVCQSARAA